MEPSAQTSGDSMQVVREAISSGAVLSVPYLVMNALAAVVASYGLLEDSSAVVIGAMIIAMLLGPIIGLALAIVDGDTALLKRSLLAEATGAAVVLVVACVIGYVHRDLPLSNEILSRTSPNLLDLMIALAGGAAGAYATVSPKLSAGLVGVAIATALVPPLATCSICLARGDYHLAFGGFLLFLANLVAIQFASSVVMWLRGFHRLTSGAANSGRYFTRISVSAVLLLVLAFTLAENFYRTVEKEGSEARTRDTLRKALAAFPGVYLADVRFAAADSHPLVYAVVRAPYSIGPREVGKIEEVLPLIDGARPELHVRSVITKEATAAGYQFGQAAPADAADVKARETDLSP